ncbi:MAG: hypothetical protein AAF549_00545 [Pseudomonadota bacterium]
MKQSLIAVAAIILFNAIPAPSHAGFEFLAPPEAPKNAPSVPTAEVPQISSMPALPPAMPPAMVPVPNMPVAVPAPVVNQPVPLMPPATQVPMSAPMPAPIPAPGAVAPVPMSPVVTGTVPAPVNPVLDTPMTQTQINNMPDVPGNPNMAPIPTAPVTVGTPGRIVIDPYPLHVGIGTPVYEDAAIDQSMMEKARVLTPVQLGAGMTTGAQAQYRPPEDPVPVPQMSKGTGDSFSTASLTPMLGAEAPPLPGFENSVMGQRPLRQYAQAIGFGKDLPLALAISQVVPSEFTHRFEGNVDPSARVSWDGGKPWNLVLADMLGPQNMTANIQGDVVVIRNLSSI